MGSSLFTLNPGSTGLTKLAVPSGTDGFGSAEELAPAPGCGVCATSDFGTAVIELFDASGHETDFSVNGNDPGTLAENPGGGIDYGNGSSSINTIDASGNTASYPLPSSIGIGEVYSMAFDRNGNPWYGTFSGGGFAEPGPDGAIWFSWSTTPNGEQAKMPSGIGRLDPSTGQYQLFDTVKSNSLVPGSIAFGGDGALYFLDSADNLVGKISDPASLFTSSPGPGPGPGPGPSPTPKKRPLAPRPKLSVAHTSLRAIGRHHRLRVTCRLRSAGRCTVRAQVSARVARQLGVKVEKHAKRATLAHASRKRKKKGTAHLTLRFSARTSRRMTRRHRLELQLVVTVTAPHHRARTVTRCLTLHR